MTDMREKLTEYVQDAHAMEANVLKMLDSMISTTDDAEIRRTLEAHRTETEEHERRLRERLETLGVGTSVVRDAPAVMGAMLKGLMDRVRTDKPGRNARDAFVTEHFEIAAYELLERMAVRAGDEQTAEIARLNRRDEEEMARKISEQWDKFVDLTLEQAGVTV